MTYLYHHFHSPRLATCFTLFALSAKLLAAEASLTIDVEVGAGTGDPPMIIVWLETNEGDFVRTLQVFSKDKKYYKDLTVWWKSHDGNAADPIDAVIGPTIKYTSSKSASIPLALGGINILDGKYQLHIEQRRDKGGHYKKLRVPLPATFASGSIAGEGYISKINFTVKR